MQSIKDFDFLLDCPSVKNLTKLRNQRLYLAEKSSLLNKLQDVVDWVEFKFQHGKLEAKDIAEYKTKLEEGFNSDIQKQFDRISQDDWIYYGQLNKDSKKHGIGTILYDNGFCYQGMFENDQMTGIGTSID